MKTNEINNMRTFHSKLAVAALAALFALTAPAGAAPIYGLSFNGTSAYVGTSTGVIPSSGDFTVEFWAACPTAPSAYKEILSQGSSGNALYIGTDTANNIRLGDGWGTVSPAVAFPLGGWHHFAVVKSSANTIFYLDGTNRLARGSAMANPAASTGLQFGCQYGGIGEYWPGSIGDVRVWSEALSAAQIATSLTNQLTGSEANLVANWQFKEGAGTNCTSIGPTPVKGTLINGPVWIAPIAPQVVALGTTNLTESPVAGSDSVALEVSPAGASWTATANASWLHVTSASGTGSTNVIFTFDANTNATRTATLTVAGQTVTITQAGSCYVQANPLTTLVSSGVSSTFFVAVDGAGNVDVVDDGNDAIEEWTPSSGNLTTLISGLSNPWGAGVDGAGNVCFYNPGNNVIEKWNVAAGNLTTLFSGASGLVGMAVDSAGNVIYCDSSKTVKRWNAASNTVTSLVTNGLNSPMGVAVDVAGNVYIADSGSNAIKVWNAAGSNVTTLVSSNSVTPLYQPNGVAVDGAGNVYIADTFNDAIKRWNAVNSTVSTVVSSNGLYRPRRVAVDGAGNVYIGDELNRALMETPRAFVNTTPLMEGVGAGNDALPVVLPATANLAGVFAPTSDQPWLTITGVTNGVVSFSFSANPGPGGRTAHITLLGQLIPVTQVCSLLALTAEAAGPAAGANAVVLAVSPANAPWSATANASWLHVTTASGTGSTNVLFTLDANPGGPRTGTLTVAGQTLTITQAGAGYVLANPLTTLVSSNSITPLYQPCGVAVDEAGNVYFSDATNNTMMKWNAAGQYLTALIPGGLSQPSGVAVDGAGDVFFADTGHHAILECNAAGFISMVASALNQPRGVAVDGAGNVYFSDATNNTVMKWNAASQNPTTLVTGLNQPRGVAVDGMGNVYIADTGNNAVEKWVAASQSLTTLVPFPLLNQPSGVAVDGAGNVYIADTGNNAIKEWNAASQSLTTLVSTGLNQPSGVAVDGTGNVYIADTGNSAIKELPRAFVNSTPVLEGAGAGNDALPVVLPATANLAGVFAPTSDQPWLTITGVTNGVVSFSFGANPGPASRTAHLTLLGQLIPVMQAGFLLGLSAEMAGPAAGTNAVVLAVSPANAPWSATANASWLHLSTASGTGSANVLFTLDANPGGMRTGTLTIASQTLTITQAGAAYVLAASLTTLFSGLGDPYGVAVDGAGNVYIADTYNNAIKEWNAAGSNLTTLVSSNSMTPLYQPFGVAVDGSGNVYIADAGNGAIKKWNAAGSNVTTLVSSGLNYPEGVAVDGAGNVYIADTDNNAIKEWNAASGTVSALVSSGLSFPCGVAVDGAGNVYIADTCNSAVKKWNAANSSLTALADSSSGLNNPQGVAVDGAGNVYIADLNNNAIKEWTVANSNLTTLADASSGLSIPYGVAVDGAGNVFIADTGNNAVKELPRAFVDTTAFAEGLAAGSDSLPVVLPAAQNLSGAFAPTSDQPWLAITGVTNGVVSFSFTANSSTFSRTANISLLGQTIPVTQIGFPLGLAAEVAGPAAGTNSVILSVSPTNAWSAAANDSWLHLSTASGTGSTNVLFTLDANPGGTRTGTLTVAGQTLTITQAGAGYVLAASLTTLVSSGLNQPYGVAVDAAGNVYIADTYNDAIKEWSMAGSNLTTLVSSNSMTPLYQPFGVAVDGGGNVCISDTYNNAVKKWSVASSNLTTLLSSGLNTPWGVAVDGAGNVYIADTFNSAIKKWNVTGSNVNTLADWSSGLSYPSGVAVDGAGNVYIADTDNSAIKEWNATNGSVTTLVSAGLNSPCGVAVDGAGNVYIADTGNSAIAEWNAASGSVTALASPGLYFPDGVAVDGAGNVYIADTYNNAIEELPRAFVCTNSVAEGATAGSDALPAVLPASENLSGIFAPSSDQLWLTITGVANGVVSFSFTANTNTSPRTANITLLGQTIPITQSAQPLPPAIANWTFNGSHQFQLQFTGASSSTYTVLSTTNVALPLTNWVPLSPVIETSPGQYQITDTNAPAGPHRFYLLRWP